ncbi:hypothetical protein [Pseudoxanthomonas kaohsiungensis]|uniref:Uncharacterized protein n=1 Tax=Pseudoxanthomonas kaohsiungensis TaxID=283923 RepID=A0ABW3LQP6_9GAMM|nr:hypothetical protein [Pseudoxanthomonas kaohsiungensis]KAF1704298.1 hypothetical protein CSC66_05500 [Pseudoxanthomonas kaohsiungensis]
MNITEQSLVAGIALAISGAVIWLGSAAFDQVEANTTYFEQMADMERQPVVLAEVARIEAERRQRQADEHIAHAK